MKWSTFETEVLKAISGSDSDLDKLFDPIAQLSHQQCLQIYRQGYRARLIESLGNTFEACWWVLGDEAFFKVAGEYIADHPSKVDDLSNYGEGFPDFSARHQMGQDIPFLQDLANFEWCFRTVFHQAALGPTVDLSKNPSDQILKISDRCRIFQSEFSVYEIWKLRAQDISVLNELEIDNPAQLVLYREHGQVYVKSLSKVEYSLFNLLTTPRTISEAAEIWIDQENVRDPALVAASFQNLTVFLELPFPVSIRRPHLKSKTRLPTSVP